MPKKKAAKRKAAKKKVATRNRVPEGGSTLGFLGLAAAGIFVAKRMLADDRSDKTKAGDETNKE
jgi:hypothetical protein